MDENLVGTAAVTDRTCGICLEDSKDPLDLPCGHSFCDGCLGEWRSRYGVKEEMRTKCPTCRARIPPSKEMVATVLAYRALKQELADRNKTSTENYHKICQMVEMAEEKIGADWDGVTVLQDNNDKTPVEMPGYVFKAIGRDIALVLRWINANRTEDRVNAITSSETMGMSVLSVASYRSQLMLMTLLLQLGANVDYRDIQGITAIGHLFADNAVAIGEVSERVRLLLTWGANFFLDADGSREECISAAMNRGEHDLANLVEAELGGRRCEITNLASRPELNGKTCVADEYLPGSNQYKVTLENKSKEVLVISAENLKRRDRTPQDCGYYVEFKNGRTTRHDFDSNEDCEAFVALSRDETPPAVTEESEARAEQAAAELLAELGLDDSPNESSSGCKVKKSKKKRDKRKKKK